MQKRNKHPNTKGKKKKKNKKEKEKKKKKKKNGGGGGGGGGGGQKILAQFTSQTKMPLPTLFSMSQ